MHLCKFLARNLSNVRSNGKNYHNIQSSHFVIVYKGVKFLDEEKRAVKNSDPFMPAIVFSRLVKNYTTETVSEFIF
jgi:hypothetical protein